MTSQMFMIEVEALGNTDYLDSKYQSLVDLSHASSWPYIIYWYAMHETMSSHLFLLVVLARKTSSN